MGKVLKPDQVLARVELLTQNRVSHAASMPLTGAQQPPASRVALYETDETGGFRLAVADRPGPTGRELAVRTEMLTDGEWIDVTGLPGAEDDRQNAAQALQLMYLLYPDLQILIDQVVSGYSVVPEEWVSGTFCLHVNWSFRVQAAGAESH